ncbi:MAG: transcriptional repressor LexA [bacterium]|nr:MAG: transcriptional repressor LexA [bacterium]
MRKAITETQKRVFQVIIDFVDERGFPPTIREIMSLMGYSSVNNVQRILNVLEKKGYINRNLRGGARCIEVVERASPLTEFVKRIPVLGTVAARTPLFAEQNIEGYITFNPEITGINADFVLRVTGDSMRDAYINDNDLIFVRKMNFPNNNDIIVALLDEEATVKRFFHEDNQIRLQPENPDHQPIFINKNDLYFKVLGKVEAVMHKI